MRRNLGLRLILLVVAMISLSGCFIIGGEIEKVVFIVNDEQYKEDEMTLTSEEELDIAVKVYDYFHQEVTTCTVDWEITGGAIGTVAPNTGYDVVFKAAKVEDEPISGTLRVTVEDLGGQTLFKKLDITVVPAGYEDD